MRVILAATAAFATAHASAGPHPLSRFPRDGLSWAAAQGAAVSVGPTVLARDGDWVTVDIALNAGTPFQPGDVLAAYSPPAPADLSSTTPVEYFSLATACPTLATTGKCTLRAQLINMRAAYSFVYVQGANVNSPLAIGVSANITFADLNAPRAPRLAVTSTPSEMRLTWSSARSDLHPRALFWPANTNNGGGAAVTVVPATSVTYGRGDLCGAPATTVGYRDTGWVNSAVMAGLVPGQRYNYTFGDDGGFFGVNYTFTQPGGGYPVGLAAFGDMGQMPEDGSTEEYPFPPAPQTARWVQQLVDAGEVHAVGHVGDLSYARGYGSEWDVFFFNLNDTAARVPYLVSTGNHEADWAGASPFLPGMPPTQFNVSDSGGECAVPALTLFPMPSPSPAEPWFVAPLGPVLLVFMATEYDFSTGSAQYAFLRDTLAGVDRAATPWVVLTGHRPMYIDSTNFDVPTGDQPVAEALRQYIEPLLLDAGGSPVDFALWGHHHSYQR